MRFFCRVLFSLFLFFSINIYGYIPDNFKNDYQFILFYRASCPHCQRFDPVLKEYSQNIGIKVMAFTLDGVSLSAFPNSIPVSHKILEQYFGNNEILVPTLFLLNRENLHAYPVSVGELNYHELASRINNLVPKIINFERSQHV